MNKIERSAKIREFLLKNISDTELVSHAVTEFAISRAAVYQNLEKLVSAGIVKHDNAKKNRKYELITTDYYYKYDIAPGLSESDVWIKDVKKHMPLKDNLQRIWSYGFTEIFNNAIDHSQGSVIMVKISVDTVKTNVSIIDNGIGIFRKIKEKFNLQNEDEAIFELSKGKLTTDKINHSGQGIFFTSKIFDRFIIWSHNVFFTTAKQFNSDWVLDDANDVSGTMVIMEISNNSEENLADVFDEFSSVDYGFTKTRIPIELAKYGDENLVSRSQAKRVLSRAHMFENIVLDFHGVPSIGQAFADEIFRVFTNANTDIEISYINANRDVENMINRAKTTVI